MNRLGRCTGIITGGGGARSALPRREPLKYIYEKEIVMYGHCEKKLDYFSTECIYSPGAF